MTKRRLSNDMRDKFVGNVMSDVPQVDYHEEIRKAVLADAIKRLPSAVRKLWDDEKTRGWINMQSVNPRHPDGLYRNLSITVPARHVSYEEQDTPGFKDHAKDVAAPLWCKDDEQVATRHALRERIAAVARSCRNIEGLEAALPDFAKYIPIAQGQPAPAYLPALQGNVIDLFKKAGWPAKKAA